MMIKKFYNSQAKKSILKERRLAMRRAAEAAGQGESAEENNVTEQQPEAAQAVDATRNATQRGVNRIAGPEIANAPSTPVWKPLPRPNMKAARNTAMVAGAAALPPVAAAAAVGYFGWKGLKKLPGFKQVDTAGRWLGNKAVGLGGNVVETAAYPFKFGGRLGMNATRAVGRGISTVGHYGVMKPLRSIERALGYELEGGQRTNILESTIIISKKALIGLVKYPFKIGEAMLDQIDNHPIKATIGAILGAAAITNWAGVVAGGGELIKAITEVIASFAV